MTSFRIDFSEVEALADRTSRLTGQQLGRAALGAVNKTATNFERRMIDGEIANINLSRTYVRSKTDLRLATNPASPVAEILTRGDLTPLGNFEPLATIRAPGALRRAGAIKGRRNAGTIVQIRKTSTSVGPQWFTLPLRRGDIPGGNGRGVFVRSSSLSPSPTATREGHYGKRQIYGPAPYALARRQILVQGPQLQRDLEDNAIAAVLDELERAVF